MWSILHIFLLHLGWGCLRIICHPQGTIQGQPECLMLSIFLLTSRGLSWSVLKHLAHSKLLVNISDPVAEQPLPPFKLHPLHHGRVIHITRCELSHPHTTVSFIPSIHSFNKHWKSSSCVPGSFSHRFWSPIQALASEGSGFKSQLCEIKFLTISELQFPHMQN